ncbi:hypothetical protein C7974DRAFT_54264 [Boeremia exigua]|uniref:uncharacterized protein n=1 Tax=Boeremia exigua TaxID=749465 RepID=UPI001E8DFFE2|nr:uncharacterized protein C7974DRAFT_54264 [Boeremia exigua]KAH6614801.1 hypothetical protein C7974DRAFT_54264 [Boeremia exigua]
MRTFIMHTPDKWFAAVAHDPRTFYFNPPLGNQPSNVAVRLLAQKLRQGEAHVIQAIDEGLIFNGYTKPGEGLTQLLPTGREIWRDLFESASELWIATVRAWAGRSLATEGTTAARDIELALDGIIALVNISGGPKLPVSDEATAAKGAATSNAVDTPLDFFSRPVALFASNNAPYSITITNAVPGQELTLNGWHLFDSWLVTKSQSPQSQPLRTNDPASLSWSYWMSWVVSGGIMGFYDGWMSYRLPNGKCFGVRIHVPTQVGPGIGTRPSYMTSTTADLKLLNGTDSVWTFHDEPSKPYYFTEAEVGNYQVIITPASSSSSLTLDVQVMPK